ncbi:MAG: hypothetical protein Q8P20_09245 [bacterium]|nr:hypothetical protein [bacterium]
MSISKLQKEGEQIALSSGFKISEVIYTGEFYTPDKIRNVIFSGTYKDKPAVLKVYDDPRVTDEPLAQQSFLKFNQST